jgi:hypothetical protein
MGIVVYIDHLKQRVISPVYIKDKNSRPIAGLTTAHEI